MPRAIPRRLDWHFWLLLVLLAIIASTRAHSYLLFHALAELAWIVVALTSFALAWNTRKNLDNPVLLTIAISLGPLAVVRILHTLAFKGMGVFVGYDANLPTQLWVAERALEVAVVLVAVFVAPRRIEPTRTLAITTALAIGLVIAIFQGAFPDCYVEGQGLTTFKVAVEYMVMAAFALALVRLRKLAKLFPPRLLSLMQAAMVLSIIEEAAFTLYVDVYGAFNMVGHLVQGVYAVLIYLGLIRFGLAEPQQALYHQLQTLNARLAEEALHNNERAAMAVEAVGGSTWEWDMAAGPPTGSQWDRVVEEDRETFDILAQPRSMDGGRSAEYRIRRPDGAVAWMTSTTRVFTTPNGPRMVGLDQDITARKAVEAERATLAADIQRFAEILAHHLQEPARLQSCFAQMLRQRLPAPLSPDVAAALDVVQTGAEHLRRLLRDAHLYIVLDRLPPPDRPVDAGAALARAWEFLQDRAAAVNATLTAAKLPSVWMAASRLEDLFAVLLSNALEYRRPSVAPAIQVDWSEEGGEIVIRVADNGIGIEPEYLQRIFIAFERLHTADEHPGTGIGLALARRIVESAGGRIWATSVSGEGATFHIAVPRGRLT